MKVYLLQDLKGKGKKGDIIEVSEGYGRNFLVPKKIATLVDAKVLSEKKSQDDAKNYHKEQEILNARKTVEFLKGKTVEVRVKTGADGKFFGSVTAKEVADAIKSSFDVEVNKKRIDLPEIRQFGTFDFLVKVYPKIVAKMKLTVLEQ